MKDWWTGYYIVSKYPFTNCILIIKEKITVTVEKYYSDYLNQGTKINTTVLEQTDIDESWYTLRRIPCFCVAFLTKMCSLNQIIRNYLTKIKRHSAK